MRHITANLWDIQTGDTITVAHVSTQWEVVDRSPLVHVERGNNGKEILLTLRNPSGNTYFYFGQGGDRVTLVLP